MQNDELVIGLDIGTQGTRAVITNLSGMVQADCEVKFDKINVSKVAGHQEQEPEAWWNAAVKALRACILKIGSTRKDHIKALAIDSTSGTVVALDKDYKVVHNALMYNDSRTTHETEKIRCCAGKLESVMGYKVNPSFGLPKMLWLSERHKEKAAYLIHQSDYICGKLTGEYLITDYSNALKSCYDLIENQWPAFIEKLGLDLKRMPNVTAPGTVIGEVSREVSEIAGLPFGVKVVAGATDGYASSLSSGIADVGDWSTVIGTTMVLKGIEKELIVDPKGRIYSHKHPQGYWLLGGASNVGGYCLNLVKREKTYEEMNSHVKALTPTGIPCYPLVGEGERFPFVSASAKNIFGKAGVDPYTKYTALMEGVGYAERLAYEVLMELGCNVSDTIYASGGACKSLEWLQIRSDILGRSIKVPVHTGAALGSAVIASLAVGHKDLKEASGNMIRIARKIEPSNKHGLYEDGYMNTKKELEKRGYL